MPSTIGVGLIKAHRSGVGSGVATSILIRCLATQAWIQKVMPDYATTILVHNVSIIGHKKIINCLTGACSH